MKFATNIMHMRFHRAFLAPIALLAATHPPPETTPELRKDDQLGGFVRITQATRIVGEEYKHDATSMTRAMYFVKEGNKNPDNNNVPTQSVNYCTPCEAAQNQACCVPQVHHLFFPYQRAVIATIAIHEIEHHDDRKQPAQEPAHPPLLLRHQPQPARHRKVDTRRRTFLVIGLGGGVLPIFLRAKFPQADIEVVEISAVVIDLARKYFGLAHIEQDSAKTTNGGSLRVVHADGRAYVRTAVQQQRRYHVIVLDAYAHGIPKSLSTLSFFHLLQQVLDPQDGIIVANVDGSGTTGQMTRALSRMMKGYTLVFGPTQVSELDLGRSKVVVVGEESDDDDVLGEIARKYQSCVRGATSHHFSALEMCTLVQKHYTRQLCLDASVEPFRDDDEEEDDDDSSPRKKNKVEAVTRMGTLKEACELERLVERGVISRDEYEMMHGGGATH